jgi:hypothetical protein
LQPLAHSAAASSAAARSDALYTPSLNWADS